MSGDHNMHCSANQPVAWKGEMEDGRVGLGWDKIEMQEEYPFVMPLYPATPKRDWVGLSYGQKLGIIDRHTMRSYDDQQDMLLAIIADTNDLLKEKNQ